MHTNTPGMHHEAAYINHVLNAYYDVHEVHSQLQWNLWTRDTMGPTILSLVERSSLSRRSNNWVPFVKRSSLSRRVPYQRFHSVLLLHGWLFQVMANPRSHVQKLHLSLPPWPMEMWSTCSSRNSGAPQRLTDCSFVCTHRPLGSSTTVPQMSHENVNIAKFEIFIES